MEASSHDSQDDRNIGKTIGRFRVLRRIGSGGMADVYLATTSGLEGFEKRVVLKVLRQDKTADVDALAMFLDEARIAARMSHPNIVQTFEVGVHDEQTYYLVMEHVEGVSLLQLRQAAGDLTLDLQLAILVQVLAALEYAHTLRDEHGELLNIIHRDVSAGNIMVTPDGNVKLLDFGIARTRLNRRTTQTGAVRGTLRYIAPEAIRGESIDLRSDVYAVGILLWEAMTSRPFLGGEAPGSVMMRVSSGEYPAASDVEKVDPLLDLVCARAMESEPVRRFSSAREFRTALLHHFRTTDGLSTVERLGAMSLQVLSQAESKRRQRFSTVPSSALAVSKSAVAQTASAQPRDSELPEPAGPGPVPTTRGSSSAPPPAVSLYARPSSPSVRAPVPQRRSRWQLMPLALAAVVVFGTALLMTTLLRRAGVGAQMPTISLEAPMSTSSASGATAPSEPAPRPEKPSELGRGSNEQPGDPHAEANPAPPASSAPRIDPPPATSAATAGTSVQVQLGSFPRIAKIRTGGLLLDCNPCSLSQPHGTVQDFTISAAGFVPRTVRVQFDRSKTLDLAMLLLPSKNAVVAPSASTAARPPAVEDGSGNPY